MFATRIGIDLAPCLKQSDSVAMRVTEMVFSDAALPDLMCQECFMSPKPAIERLTQVAPQAGVMVEGSRLDVMRTLQRADFGAFQDACNALMHSKSPQVILDLTRCTYVSSLFIGMLVDAVTTMKTAGKVVNVVVSPQVGRFLHMAHLYHLFDYSIVEPPEGPGV